MASKFVYILSSNIISMLLGDSISSCHRMFPYRFVVPPTSSLCCWIPRFCSIPFSLSLTKADIAINRQLYRIHIYIQWGVGGFPRWRYHHQTVHICRTGLEPVFDKDTCGICFGQTLQHTISFNNRLLHLIYCRKHTNRKQCHSGSEYSCKTKGN